MKKSYLKYPQRAKKSKRLLVADFICALATASVLLGAFPSCRTQYIPVPEVHQRDSLVMRVNKYVDSIYIDRSHTEKLIQGFPDTLKTTNGGLSLISSFRVDTLVVKDSIYVEKVRDREVNDTIRVTLRDSIPYPVEVPKYIRQRNWYDRATSCGFWLLFIGVILYFIFKFFLGKLV